MRIQAKSCDAAKTLHLPRSDQIITTNIQMSIGETSLIASQLLQNLALRHLPVSIIRRRLGKKIIKQSASFNTEKQLLIDVSVIAKADAETGIQRVVRNLYQELLITPPAGYRICPITATRKKCYCYLSTAFLQNPTESRVINPPVPVQIYSGDLFLGLDLAAQIIPHRLGELLCWKRHGVRMIFFVYDLLPVLKPAWFNPKTTKNFRRWLRALAILANDVIAISRTVQIDFIAWMQHIYGLDEYDIHCATIQLGTGLNDIHGRQPVTGQHTNQLLQQLTEHKFILMVGTIEPRKGHEDILNAFEQLWMTGSQTNLIFAGKQGWKVEPFIHRLQTHHEAGKRFHWLNSPSDETLQALYQNCIGLIMASKGEGYGLPLIEAAYYNKPVLVRDIPIFREIIGEAASYFPAAGHDSLMLALLQWLGKLGTKDLTPLITPKWITWKESCAQLTRALLK